MIQTGYWETPGPALRRELPVAGGPGLRGLHRGQPRRGGADRPLRRRGRHPLDLAVLRRRHAVEPRRRSTTPSCGRWPRRTPTCPSTTSTRCSTPAGPTPRWSTGSWPAAATASTSPQAAVDNLIEPALNQIIANVAGRGLRQRGLAAPEPGRWPGPAPDRRSRAAQHGDTTSRSQPPEPCAALQDVGAQPQSQVTHKSCRYHRVPVDGAKVTRTRGVGEPMGEAIVASRTGHEPSRSPATARTRPTRRQPRPTPAGWCPRRSPPFAAVLALGALALLTLGPLHGAMPIRQPIPEPAMFASSSVLLVPPSGHPCRCTYRGNTPDVRARRGRRSSSVSSFSARLCCPQCRRAPRPSSTRSPAEAHSSSSSSTSPHRVCHRPRGPGLPGAPRRTQPGQPAGLGRGRRLALAAAVIVPMSSCGSSRRSTDRPLSSGRAPRSMFEAMLSLAEHLSGHRRARRRLVRACGPPCRSSRRGLIIVAYRGYTRLIAPLRVAAAPLRLQPGARHGQPRADIHERRRAAAGLHGHARPSGPAHPRRAVGDPPPDLAGRRRPLRASS